MDKKLPKGKASLLSKKSPAAKYAAPNILTIATKIGVEEDIFLPVYTDDSVADVKCLIPILNHQNVQCVWVNHWTILTIDCGFTIEIPAGYQIQATAKKDWAVRGLFVSKCFIEPETNKFKIMVTNIGLETPLIVPHKAIIAQIWATPSLQFDWKTL